MIPAPFVSNMAPAPRPYHHLAGMPVWVPDEAFMAMALMPSGLENISGVVRYPAGKLVEIVADTAVVR